MNWWLIALIILGIVAATGLVFWFWLKAHPDKPERWVNTTSLAPPYPIPPDIQTKHDSLFIVDLHADSLLWQRDLAVKNDYGQLDLPRMKEGGIDLQVFSAVTKFTLGTMIFNHTHPTPRMGSISFPGWCGYTDGRRRHTKACWNGPYIRPKSSPCWRRIRGAS